MAQSREVYKGVYVMKFLMAYMVVAIHTTDWSLMGLLDTAVPYFFLASGFFLFRKLGGTREEDLAAIKQWIIKSLKLYLIWSVIYMPFTVIGYLNDDLSIAKVILSFIRNLLFIGSSYYSWSLWYLLGMVWAGCGIYLLRRMNISVLGMFLIGCALYLSESIFNFHDIPLYSKIFATTRNGIFVGFPFITAGGLIQYFRENVLSSKNLLLLSIAITAISFLGLQSSSLFLAPLSIGIFVISIKISCPSLSITVSKRLGSMSKTVYLVHMIFVATYLLLSLPENNWVCFFSVALCSTMVAWGIGRFFQNRELSWIR